MQKVGTSTAASPPYRMECSSWRRHGAARGSKFPMSQRKGCALRHCNARRDQKKRGSDCALPAPGARTRGASDRKNPRKSGAKFRSVNIGKHVSDETRHKLSLRMIGTALHRGHLHTEETKQIIRKKKTGVPIHSDEFKQHRAERWKGNSLTKGKPWSAARRLAWLQRKET